MSGLPRVTSNLHGPTTTYHYLGLRLLSLPSLSCTTSMYSVVVIFQQVNLLCHQPVTRELLVYYRSYTSMITKPSSLNEGGYPRLYAIVVQHRCWGLTVRQDYVAHTVPGMQDDLAKDVYHNQRPSTHTTYHSSIQHS